MLLLTLVGIAARGDDLVASSWWYSGFENGFPGDPGANEGLGEWLDFAGPYANFAQDGTDGGQNPNGCAWTILDRDDSEVEPVAGDHIYKGWVYARAQESHRAYPCIDVTATLDRPIVNSFMVYLDADYASLGNREWISLATWSNTWWNEGLHTIAVLGSGQLEMAHLDWDYVGPTPQADFPLRQWVRITWYLNPVTGGGDGTVLLWQDGVLTFRGKKPVPSSDKATFHWGMYASGGVDRAVMYNDEIRLWTLDEPWNDPNEEPIWPGG
jgi:hypothetical protein